MIKIDSERKLTLCLLPYIETVTQFPLAVHTPFLNFLLSSIYAKSLIKENFKKGVCTASGN